MNIVDALVEYAYKGRCIDIAKYTTEEDRVYSKTREIQNTTTRRYAVPYRSSTEESKRQNKDT